MREERLIFLKKEVYIKDKDHYKDGDVKKLLFGSMFKEYENWLKKEIEGLKDGFTLDDYIERPLGTLEKYLNENIEANGILEIIMMYIESERSRIENTISKTKLEDDILYDILVQKYRGLDDVFDTDLKNQKMDLLMDVLESIVAKVETFEKIYFQELEKTSNQAAETKKEERCIKEYEEGYFEIKVEMKIASEKTGNFFYCVF